MIKKYAFTLMEILVVIIVLGVVAGLGTFQYFKAIQISYATEALQQIEMIKQSMERCRQEEGDFAINCNGAPCPTGCTYLCNFDTIDVEDPSNLPNSHFTYTLYIEHGNHFEVWAVRNSRDGGSNSSRDRISLTHDGGSHYWIDGYGIYSSVRVGSTYGSGDHYCSCSGNTC